MKRLKNGGREEGQSQRDVTTEDQKEVSEGIAQG